MVLKFHFIHFYNKALKIKQDYKIQSNQEMDGVTDVEMLN